MKKHAIIPIFIPHRGCPNDCVFCNQKAITARVDDVTSEDVRNTIETWLPTLQGRGIETIEVAFFGGSFTGIPIEDQSAFLAVAKEYKDAGRISRIHMSTRPDYISREVLQNLRNYGADVIELGVQSFDPDVLAASNRGHSVEAVYEACDLIKEFGFELGIQLMIGLPGDSLEKCIYSAREAVKIGPSIARLYPTIVLNDTELLRMFERGEYRPLTTDEAVQITKEMYRILDAAGINIIRVGLKSTDLINDSDSDTNQTVGHTYHPAFRQLVEGEIAKEELESQLEAQLVPTGPGPMGHPVDNFGTMGQGCVEFLCHPDSFSNMVGNGGRNREYFAKKYPELKIRFGVDKSLDRGKYVCKLC